MKKALFCLPFFCFSLCNAMHKNSSDPKSPSTQQILEELRVNLNNAVTNQSRMQNALEQISTEVKGLRKSVDICDAKITGSHNYITERINHLESQLKFLKSDTDESGEIIKQGSLILGTTFVTALAMAAYVKIAYRFARR